MSYGQRPPLLVVVTRPGGKRIEHGATTPEAAALVVARLAPHVPLDATWEIQPCAS